MGYRDLHTVCVRFVLYANSNEIFICALYSSVGHSTASHQTNLCLISLTKKFNSLNFNCAKEFILKLHNFLAISLSNNIYSYVFISICILVHYFTGF